MDGDLAFRLAQDFAHSSAEIELVRGAVDRVVELIESGHFFVGGSSPVASLQMLDAVRRAANVAAAPMPAYRPLQSSFRNTPVS